MEKRGRPRKNRLEHEFEHVEIDFNQITKLNKLDIDPRMMEQMESGTVLDSLISHEKGVPAATNIMIIGDPGVGKTTLLLDLLASTQLKNPDKKCLFISGEMGKKQMFKYTQRFPHFGIIETMFVSDYTNHNTKDVIEQLLTIGWDLILIDSIAEVIEGVRDDNGWDRKTAESWLVDICVQNNKGWNTNDCFSTFLLIQQVTKSGVFVGSNKLKHLVDAAAEIRKEGITQGEGTYIEFTKNRNGSVNERLYFQLTGTQIVYSNVKAKEEVEDDDDEVDENIVMSLRKVMKSKEA
jgi:predicted ATP-dependent serine protease